MFEGFPRTGEEFDERFSTEEDCWAYLVETRWPEGFRCPACSSAQAWLLSCKRAFECRGCGRQTSVTAGTVLHGTRKPLKLWFRAVFLMTALKTGVSAKALQRILGLTYKVAWTWSHKLRAAIAARPRERLQGLVEVDEAYIGGPEEGLDGREHGDKAIVLVAAEDRGLPTGRIRLQVVEAASQDVLTPAVQANVEPGALVHTDQWAGYGRLQKADFAHLAERGGGKDATEIFPHVHRVISLVKRLLLGTFQGSVGKRHMQAYLDEFTFRFNRRRSRHVTRAAAALLALLPATRPRPYHVIVGRGGRGLSKAA